MLFLQFIPISLVIQSWCKTTLPTRSLLIRGLAAAKNNNGGKESTKIPIILKEEDLMEKFTRGSGPGGQAVNKTSNRVQLTHIPSGITVASHETRELSANRKIARRKLTEQLDLMYNGKESKVAKKQDKIRRRKSRARRRSNQKYGHTNEDNKESAEDDSEDGDDEEDDETDELNENIDSKESSSELNKKSS